ncbi:hypothetical protein [Arcicella rosea]|uniref:Uncharacterized protein n=1 Tax=Arcicella rosea TaxID=502909 RepID=A0A841EKD1_9BACT|nr:hypothetical protein [Arcicella rosea]MBB6003396.1 hypothetical protein [Arcicella rosea]
MENVKSEYLNKVITIKIRPNSHFQGILIGVGANWLLLQYIPVDFITDGYVLLNQKYISEINISEDDIFTQKVIELKGVNSMIFGKVDLENSTKLFEEFREKSTLIGIELKNHQKRYVGFVTKEREKSIRVQLISKNCSWLNEETFLYNELRAIYFEDDYLHSLNLYINQGK